MALKNIYFDTSSLRAANWPLGSNALRATLSLANASGIRVVIPEIVLEELKAQYIRDFRSRVDRVREAIDDLETLAGELFSVPLPDPSIAASLWDHVHTEMFAGFSFARAPWSKSSLAEVATRAARHAPPFKDDDSCFRDSLIALLIEEDPARTEESLLVAHDGAFQKDPIAGFLRNCGCRVVKTVQEALEHIQAEKQTEAVLKYNDFVRQLREQALQHLGSLTQFIRQNLKIPVARLRVMGTIIRVNDIVATGVRTVSLPIADQLPTETFEASIELNVAIIFACQNLAPPPRPKEVRIGEDVDTGPASWTALAGLRIEEQSIEGKATVSASVETKAGGLFEFTWLSAEFEPAPEFFRFWAEEGT